LAEIKDVPVSKVLQEESDWPEVVDVVTVRDNRGAGKKFMVHVDGKFTIFTMPTAEPVDSLEAARVRMEQWAQHIRTGNLRDDLPNDSKGDVDKERKGFARQVKRKLKL